MSNTLIYNAVMGMLVIGALAVMRRMCRTQRMPVLVGTALAALLFGLGFAGGFPLARDSFDLARLLAWTTFAHLPFLLAGMAALCWRVRRDGAYLFAAGVVVLLLVAGDAFLIEPRWLQVRHRTLTTDKLDAPLRVAVVADIQTDRPGPYELRAMQAVMDARPDLILFAGDYIHLGRRSRDYDAESAALNAIFHQVDLDAPLGMYAVQGNVDWPGEWPQVFAGLPVTAVHETTRFDVGPISLIALSMWDSFRAEVPVEASDTYQIVLGHSPNFSLGPIQADLLIAGHTHGGQVRIPFMGPLVSASAVPNAWAAGVTEIRPGTTLLVSRGIGLERSYAPRLRFLCRPELVILDLVPTK